MTHEMDIWHDSFVKIKEQTKTIEMRLFDEKRSLISTGDTIIFTDTSNKEKIDCMVINMYRYLSFEECISITVKYPLDITKMRLQIRKKCSCIILKK